MRVTDAEYTTPSNVLATRVPTGHRALTRVLMRLLVRLLGSLAVYPLRSDADSSTWTGVWVGYPCMYVCSVLVYALRICVHVSHTLNYIHAPCSRLGVVQVVLVRSLLADIAAGPDSDVSSNQGCMDWVSMRVYCACVCVSIVYVYCICPTLKYTLTMFSSWRRCSASGAGALDTSRYCSDRSRLRCLF